MHIRVRETKQTVRGKPIRRYQATWDENGRRYQETFDTRELAQDKLDRVKTLLSQGQSPASLRERGKETFGNVAAQWLASRHDLKPRTRAEYENLLAEKTRAHGDSGLSIAATFSARPVNEITREQIANWVGKLSAAGKSASTVRHHYFVVRAILAQAVADNRITVNPADHVRLPTERSAQGGTPGVVDDPVAIPYGATGFGARRSDSLAVQRVSCIWPRGADYEPGNWLAYRSATWNYRISQSTPTPRRNPV